MLQKASVLFAGRNPTPTETAAVAGGGETVLRQTDPCYMDNGPVFDAFLNEAGQVQFLINGVVVFGNDRGLNAADFPLGCRCDQQQQPAGGCSCTVRNNDPQRADQHA